MNDQRQAISYRSGDVVTLKSGGPAMTIAEVVMTETGAISVTAAYANAQDTIEIIELRADMIIPAEPIHDLEEPGPLGRFSDLATSATAFEKVQG